MKSRGSAYSSKPAAGDAALDELAEADSSIFPLIERAAAGHPDKTALAYGSSSVSYAALLRQSRDFARYLMRLDAPGRTVAMLTRKHPETVVAFLGAAAAGCAACSLDYHLGEDALARLMAGIRPAVLLHDSEFGALAENLAHHAPLPVHLVRLPGQDKSTPSQGCVHWEQALAEGSTHAHALLPDVPPDTVTYLNITSGTTGEPKPVLTTHRNLLANTRSAIAALGLQHTDIHLSFFPVFGHPHESFLRALLLGGTAILHDSVAPKAFEQAALRHRPTVLMAATTVYRTLLADNGLAPKCFATVRFAECGGMPLDAGLRTQFLERFGVPLIPVWGSTETAGIALAQRPGEPYTPNSAGRLCPGYIARLVSSEGQICSIGETGELELRGEGVCTSCLLPDGRRSSLLNSEGWLPTGDLFLADADGAYYFRGRKSGMLKVAGMRVYPMELEEVLCAHPDVEEAAVAGEAHPSRGEVPVAYVVLRAGSNIKAEDLRTHCRKELASYKVPHRILLVDLLPKSPSGKILHRLLPAPAETHTASSESQANAAPMTVSRNASAL